MCQVIARSRHAIYKPSVSTPNFAMRFVIPAALLVVALIHALPVVGVLGAGRLSGLYGIAVDDANLEILMRHRAVLFGLLAAFFAYAAFRRHLQAVALIGGMVSVVSFMVLASAVGGYNAAIATVVKADLVALALLLVAGAVRVLALDRR